MQPIQSRETALWIYNVSYFGLLSIDTRWCSSLLQHGLFHRRRLWGSPGTCSLIIEKRSCIYHFLPSFPPIFWCTTQYFWQVYASGFSTEDVLRHFIGYTSDGASETINLEASGLSSDLSITTPHRRNRRVVTVFNVSGVTLFHRLRLPAHICLIDNINIICKWRQSFPALQNLGALNVSSSRLLAYDVIRSTIVSQKMLYCRAYSSVWQGFSNVKSLKQ